MIAGNNKTEVALCIYQWNMFLFYFSERASAFLQRTVGAVSLLGALNVWNSRNLFLYKNTYRGVTCQRPLLPPLF